VIFAAITLCVASQQVFIVVNIYFVITQSGNFWIHPHIFQQNEIIDKVGFVLSMISIKEASLVFSLVMCGVVVN
jgi:uncharacterized membrane protein